MNYRYIKNGFIHLITVFNREGLIKLGELEEGIELLPEIDAMPDRPGLDMAEQVKKTMASIDKRKKIKDDIREVVNRKFQIIVALQIYNPEVKGDWTRARHEAFVRML